MNIYSGKKVYYREFSRWCYIKVLIQFRISSHSLRIETGRYEREKLQCGKIVKLHASKRVCKICNLGKIEDEQHYIMECPAYKLECNALFNMANLNIEMILIISMKKSLLVLCLQINL